MAHRGWFWFATAAWCAATVALVPVSILVPPTIFLWFASAVSMGVVMGPVRSAFWRWMGIYAAMAVGLATGFWIGDRLYPPAADYDGPPPVVFAFLLFGVGVLLVLLGIVGAGITRWMWRLLRH
jgi:hypothetical protein